MSNLTPDRVLFALHDVTPFHQQRLERAEILFAEWGIEQVAYLLIPNYHGGWRTDRDADFRRWCARRRPFDVQWFLHGYFHAVTSRSSVARLEAQAPATIAADGRVLEGPNYAAREFAHLTREETEERLTLGRNVLRRTLDREPAGFVAPVWRGSEPLRPTLRDLGFEWYEDFRSVDRLPTGVRLPAPVVTWATRTWLRRTTSLWGCPLLAGLFRGAPVLRIAMHPFDFDFPETVESIAQLVQEVVAARRQVAYDASLAGKGLPAAA